MIACPSCGLELSDDSSFCSKCGTKLAAPPAAAEERKTVTTLFCDLVAFTAMSEAADPEDVDRILGRYFALATEAVESHGGVVEKFIGDAVVGVFGVPAVHEDDSERAVRAALRILEALEGMTRPDGSPLEARCGVNTGKALVRLDVDPASGRGFLTGDAVNTAARLQSSAPPMGVVVGSLTHRLTVANFRYEELPPLSLKGKSGRVKAWLAKEPVGQARVRSTSSAALPMIGRDAELATCCEAVDGLRDGHGGLLLITGEAGIGKTRLVEEMRVHAKEQDCAWLEGRTLSFGRSISYWPFLEILQQDAGIENDDGEAERSAKLAARLTALFGEDRGDVLPYLATVLGISVPMEFAAQVGNFDGEAMGRQIYRASRLYFARLAEERPLVVVFEDVHWLDDSSAALLGHLLPLVTYSPILFCAVARPEQDTPLGRFEELARAEYAGRSTQVELHALAPADGAELLQHLTQADELPPSVRDAILRKSEGNPFFVEEIVRSLVDDGALVQDQGSGRYRVTDQVGIISIPDTLIGVIMARVDRLDDDLKQVLRLAAVIGRSFFYRLLVAIAEAEQELDQNLVGLQARELVLERAREPELEYMFKHALVQQATYDSILLQRRRELHAKVAGSIETLFADRVEDFYGLLAYHFTKAEDWEKAQDYLFKAGDQAGSVAADAEALEHYEQAMEAYSRAFGDTWDDYERATVERRMGEAFARLGQHDRARDYLFRALATLGHPFPASPGAMRRAVFTQLVRQIGHRFFPWIRRGSVRPEVARAAEARLWLYLDIHWIDTGEDQLRLLLAMLLALNLAESTRIDWATSGWLLSAGYVCDMIPLPRLSRLYHNMGARLAERLQNAIAAANVHLLMGTHEYWATGEWETALINLDLGRDEFRALGRVRDWGATMVVGTDILCDRGELTLAAARANDAVAYAEETGERVIEGWGRIRRGYLMVVGGDLAAAEEELQSAEQTLLTARQPAGAATAAGWLALSEIKRGQLDEAEKLLSDYLGPIRRYGIRGYFLRSFRTAQAELCLARAEQADESARATALREAKTACRGLGKLAKADISALVPAYRVRGTCEWLCGHQNKAESWWRKSLAKAEELGAVYEGALAELEVGRRLGDRVALARAEAAFETMGAAPDLMQARAALAESHEPTQQAASV